MAARARLSDAMPGTARPLVFGTLAVNLEGSKLGRLTSSQL